VQWIEGVWVVMECSMVGGCTEGVLVAESLVCWIDELRKWLVSDGAWGESRGNHGGSQSDEHLVDLGVRMPQRAHL
jgi:hypothetical protein